VALAGLDTPEVKADVAEATVARLRDRQPVAVTVQTVPDRKQAAWMMEAKTAERLVWAVETLAVDPADHLLEIGCGHGVAVSLVCEKLARGKIVAIDRSESMVNMAIRRNRRHVTSGKAVFHAVELGQVDLGNQRFNKIFAVNVSLFRKDPARELSIIKELLTPGGAVYLFYQPPVAHKTQELANRLTRTLRDHSFSINEVLFKDLQPVPAVCIIAEAS
jgi:cyclopropane fatty-acyl-phospholipid synthase-like methyltransferase